MPQYHVQKKKSDGKCIVVSGECPNNDPNTAKVYPCVYHDDDKNKCEQWKKDHCAS